MATLFRPRRVVCSFEVQPESVAALDRAAQLARPFDATLVVVMAGAAAVAPLPDVADTAAVPFAIAGAVEALEASYRLRSSNRMKGPLV